MKTIFSFLVFFILIFAIFLSLKNASESAVKNSAVLPRPSCNYVDPSTQPSGTTFDFGCSNGSFVISKQCCQNIWNGVGAYPPVSTSCSVIGVYCPQE